MSATATAAPPRPESSEALLRRKERLLQIMVSERHRDPSTRDDVLQEARLRLLDIAASRPEGPEAYWHAAVAKRITEVSTRGTWTGTPRRRGRPDALLTRPPLSLDATPPGSGESGEASTLAEAVVITDPASADALDQVEIGYHRGEIAQALASLPPDQRAYVYARFWGGAAPPRPAPGSPSASAAWGRWDRRIKPALAERLSHLSDLT